MRNYILAITLIFSLTAYSQSNYSQYGIGELQNAGFANNLGSANTFLGGSDSLTANFLNPASLSHLKYTSFNLGVVSNFSSIKSSTASSQNHTTNFQNLALAFPMVKNHWGLGFGIQPYSIINNISQSTGTNALLGNVTTTTENNGTLNSIFIANGFGYKGFAVGIKSQFVFGNIENSLTTNYLDDSHTILGNPVHHRQATTNNFKGGGSWLAEYSLQYIINGNDTVKGIAKNPNSFGIGLVFNQNTNLTVNNTITESLYSTDRGLIIDTISKSTSSAEIKVPKKLSASIWYEINDEIRFSDSSSIKIGTLKLGAAYTTQNWTDFEPTNTLFKNNTNYSVAMEYTPIGQNKSKAVLPTYKVGFRHSDGYLNINNTAIKETGITFGLSKKMFPKKYGQRVFAGLTLNLGVELGQRGTTNNSLFEENYAKVYLGFTFTDKWFNKPKYD